MQEYTTTINKNKTVTINDRKVSNNGEKVTIDNRSSMTFIKPSEKDKPYNIGGEAVTLKI